MNMYIYQIERVLVSEAIMSHQQCMKGKLLDVGSGSRKKHASVLKNVQIYERLDNNPEYAPDILGSADNIPKPSGEYDSIICTQVLGDLVRPEKAIREFQRVLKSGGTVLLTEGFMGELHSEPRDYWRFTPYGLRELFEQNGFKVTALEMIGSWPAVIAQMLSRVTINRLNLYEYPLWGKVFSGFFKLGGMLIKPLDKICKGNGKYGLSIIVTAEKL